jgi:adenylate cyclase
MSAGAIVRRRWVDLLRTVPRIGSAEVEGPVRVELTFAFVDLCGFSAYTQAEGAAAAAIVLANLRSVLRVAAEQRGVRIIKWLGDGVMLAGEDPRAVAACALDACDRIATSGPLALRGGLARGEVMLFEGDDYAGAAVNTAARLCHVALPNRLLAAPYFLGDNNVPATVTRELLSFH